MSKTESTMLPLGTQTPHFNLTDVVSGTSISFPTAQKHTATLIMFICNHCPYVKHVNAELTRLANDYQPKDVYILAINSNDVVNYPDDSPEKMKLLAASEQFPFPYLFDETQEVAKAYKAACTPDFFLFDSRNKLVYRGQLDDSRPGNSIPVTGGSLRAALDCLLDNKVLDMAQKPSLGCNIKWK